MLLQLYRVPVRGAVLVAVVAVSSHPYIYFNEDVTGGNFEETRKNAVTTLAHFVTTTRYTTRPWYLVGLLGTTSAVRGDRCSFFSGTDPSFPIFAFSNFVVRHVDTLPRWHPPGRSIAYQLCFAVTAVYSLYVTCVQNLGVQKFQADFFQFQNLQLPGKHLCSARNVTLISVY